MTADSQERAIRARLDDVRSRIIACGRNPRDIAIVAVTKTHGIETCRAAVAAGLTMLGENRVQEALPKIAELPQVEWHLVGHLQTNKVRVAAGRFRLIQSVDSPRLVDALSQRDPDQEVLVEVNIAREPQKHGVDPGSAVALAEYAAQRLQLRGVMAIGSRGEKAGAAFEELTHLREAAQKRVGCTLPILSMGMSDDFEAAVRAGSTMLRLGRALFGERSR